MSGVDLNDLPEPRGCVDTFFYIVVIVVVAWMFTRC
jgi:hypothetical protein